MKKMRKLLLMFVIAFAIVAGLSATTGVGAQTVKAETAKKAAGKLMKAIKTCNDNSLGNFVTFTNGGLYGNLKQSSPSYYAWVKKNNKRMTYKIKKVTQKNGMADVKVQVKCAESKELMKNVADEFDSLCTAMVNNPSSISGTSADDIYKKAIAKTKTPKMKKVTLTLHMVQYGGKWVLTNATTSDKKFTNIISCNAADSAEVLKKGMQDALNKMVTNLAKKTGYSEEYIRQMLGTSLSQLEQKLANL